MKLSLLERCGWPEPASRVFLEGHPGLKKTVKRWRNRRTQGKQAAPAPRPDTDGWEKYKGLLAGSIMQGDIVLIHSSADGLEKLGITPEACLAYLKELAEERQCTLVMPCFPITNLKPPTEKSRPYDPHKTLCWTGMLPNLFLGEPGCVRSEFPYNSLAALGPWAEEMMAGNLRDQNVYGPHSAWRFCSDRHAKILFLGVKASCSNTMAIHMVPAVMGEDWPVADWYERRDYKVRFADGIREVPVLVQRDFWYRYTMEERTSGRLKQAGLLEETSVNGCNFGLVRDSHEMIQYLIGLCKKGKRMYAIPRRYMKKR